MDLVEAHRNQVSTLRDLVLSAGRNVSPGDVEDALSFNNGDEEMTYEYLMLLYADKDKDCNRDEKDDEKVVLCATKEAVGVVKTERDDELTAEEASYEMVSSLFKGSKVETEIETALLNHEFDTEATIMHLFALQEIMEEEAAEVERVQRAGKKRRAKGHKLNLWTMGGGAELPSSRWAGNKALPMAKADHGKGREHGGNATIISGSGVARPFAAYESGPSSSLLSSYPSSSSLSSYHSHRPMADVLALIRAANPHLSVVLSTAGKVTLENFPPSPDRESSVDLHGLTVREAVELAESVLMACADSRSKQQGRQQGRIRKTTVVFIVGKGLHSQDGRSRLGPAITAKLSRHGVPYVSREGIIEASV